MALTAPRSLDDPILAALSSVHAPLALVHGLALRYPADVSPMVALREPSRRAFDDLRALVAPDEVVALVSRQPAAVPADWETVAQRFIEQMIWEAAAPPMPPTPTRLQSQDVPDMLALSALTRPGPFESGTIRMGRYYGLRAEDGRLMAMAGERLAAPDFNEVSAVCTHPDFAGRGLGRRMVAFVVGQLLGEGRQPVLHVKNENEARSLYARMGFRSNGDMAYTLLRRR